LITERMEFLYLYYNQPEAIAHLERFYKDKAMHVHFVDDGSVEPLELDWGNATVHRIEEDVKWNQPAATNLGLRKVKDDVVFRSDIDHWVAEEDLDEFLSIVPRSKEIIRFKRMAHYPDREPHEKHEGSNIFVANTAEVRACGYDERFCGNYGYDDKEFFHRLIKKHGFSVRVHERIKVNVMVGMHTKELNRDTSVNKRLYDALTKRK
jgi:predicted glycosyltransferase involved in capsule biosynthesis